MERAHQKNEQKIEHIIVYTRWEKFIMQARKNDEVEERIGGIFCFAFTLWRHSLKKYTKKFRSQS